MPNLEQKELREAVNLVGRAAIVAHDTVLAVNAAEARAASARRELERAAEEAAQVRAMLREALHDLRRVVNSNSEPAGPED
jgi:signal transduction histidine kinase